MLAFSNDYYGMIFRATQSVELFCAYEFWVDDKKISTLMLGPNIQYGLYLHYINWTEKEDLLSLYDENRLAEVAETAEEIYASIGLFLPKKKAWKAIQYFVKTGKPLSSITWITPKDIPESGNW